MKVASFVYWVKSYCALKIEIPEDHFCHILLFYFRKEKNTAQAHRKLCGVYGDECSSERQCQNWFARFRSGNFDVKAEPRPGRPIVKKVDEILWKIEVDRHISFRDIATELNIEHKIVLNHLHKTGYQKKLDTWVLHELTAKNLMDRVSICESLLKRNEIEPSLKRMITADEKWITYDNNVRKRSWSKPGEALQTVAKPVLTPRKVMPECLVGLQRNLHHELLEPSQTINLTLYCQQLMRLKHAIKKNGQNWSIGKALSSITTTLDHTYFQWLGKNWVSLAGTLWCIHRIAQTLPRPTIICFGLWRILLMV